MHESQIIAAAIQFDVQPGNVKENWTRAFTEIRKAANLGANLIVLPELWSTGYAFGRLRHLAASSQDILEEMSRAAARLGAVFVCPGLIAEDGILYNGAHVIDTDGSVRGTYRKIHLLPSIQEDLHFQAGREPLVCQTTLVKIGVLLGHDLRFPGLCRALALAQAKVLAVCAQWPESARDHWEILLRARAIENQLFVVGANRGGGAEGERFCGSSMIVAPRGEITARAGSPQETIASILDLNALYAFRREVPSLIQRRPEAGAASIPLLDENVETRQEDLDAAEEKAPQGTPPKEASSMRSQATPQESSPENPSENPS